MKTVTTSRKWGDKRDLTKTKIKVEGVSLIIIIGQDFWEGPIEAGEEGYFKRGYYIES